MSYSFYCESCQHYVFITEPFQCSKKWPENNENGKCTGYLERKEEEDVSVKKSDSPINDETGSEYMDRMLGQPGSQERRLADDSLYQHYLQIWDAQMKTRVINVFHRQIEAETIYIGRGSKWGNPFEMSDGWIREDCIAEYRKWIMTEPTLLKALPELRGKILACHCKPLPCHGDVLAELADRAPDPRPDAPDNPIDPVQS